MNQWWYFLAARRFYFVFFKVFKSTRVNLQFYISKICYFVILEFWNFDIVKIWHFEFFKRILHFYKFWTFDISTIWNCHSTLRQFKNSTLWQILKIWHFYDLTFSQIEILIFARNKIVDSKKRVNENLFTDPMDDIGSCMVYISVCKLYLFLINLFFMDQVYRETTFIADYPILNDIFLDHGIISFIMCDSIDTFIVYFYSSRYQARGWNNSEAKQKAGSEASRQIFLILIFAAKQIKGVKRSFASNNFYFYFAAKRTKSYNWKYLTRRFASRFFLIRKKLNIFNAKLRFALLSRCFAKIKI